jgi:hypothetical protein
METLCKQKDFSLKDFALQKNVFQELGAHTHKPIEMNFHGKQLKSLLAVEI